MKYVLYNPLASNKKGEAKARSIDVKCPNPYYEFIDITALSDGEFDEILSSEYEIILAGGDGTLNKFVNMTDGRVPDKIIEFYPTGSGNDFVRDVEGDREKGKLIRLNEYIKNLPLIHVNGEKHRFINGVGYGIDGYSCAMVEKKMHEKGKKGSYVLEAFMGFLGSYKPGRARITVDGVTTEYDDVWMISSMQGKYFGGGVMIAPTQNRLNEEHTVSVVVVTSKSRLKILTAFPSIFKGKHLKYKELVHIHKAKSVTVEVEEPATLQVDGEPMHNVVSYTVSTTD